MLTASISTSASGSNVVVAGVAGKRYRVLGYVLVTAGSVTAAWQTGSTPLSGAMSLVVGVPLVAPIGGDRLDPLPWMETAAGDSLVLSLGGSVQVSGHVLYDVMSV